jgi:peptidyl-prolyl cis-trans isomerase SurA
LSVVPWAHAGKVIEQIAARVNEDIITLGDIERSRRQLRQELAQQFAGAQLETEYSRREKEILRDLIDQQLLLQKAKEMNLTAETELIRRLDRIRQDMKLKSLEELEKAAEGQGVSFEDFKQTIRTQILTQQVISREVGSRITISHDEMAAFYEANRERLRRPEQVRLSEIFLTTEGKKPEEIPAIEKEAAEILERLRGGEDFAVLARRFSQGATASNGGSLGYFQRGQLTKDLEETVWKMKRNQVSDVIHTQQGLLILKLEEHFDAGIPPLDKVEGEVSEAIYMQRIQPALRTYLNQLRDDAFIEIRPGFVDTGATATELETSAAASKPIPQASTEKESGKGKKKKSDGKSSEQGKGASRP